MNKRKYYKPLLLNVTEIILEQTIAATSTEVSIAPEDLGYHTIEFESENVQTGDITLE